MLVFSEKLIRLGSCGSYDAFDVESLGEKAAFVYTGCANTSCRRDDLAKTP